ncbi:putative transcription factor interactor and regulator CCHC(Zn) family [Helianthus anomalus]
MSKGGVVLMVCRTCGKKGDHWPSKCPYKDLASPAKRSLRTQTLQTQVLRVLAKAVHASHLPCVLLPSELLLVTGMSRGFGFVNFMRREDGERAIAKLNGYGYDNLILSVEWAAPRLSQ